MFFHQFSNGKVNFGHFFSIWDHCATASKKIGCPIEPRARALPKKPRRAPFAPHSRKARGGRPIGRLGAPDDALLKPQTAEEGRSAAEEEGLSDCCCPIVYERGELLIIEDVRDGEQPRAGKSPRVGDNEADW